MIKNNLSYLLLTIMVLIPFLKASAQEGTIRGTVLNKQTGEPVIGANVLIKETKQGAATDMDGSFEIEVAPGTYNLELSYVSLQNTKVEDVEVKKGEVTFLDNIQMASDNMTTESVTIRADRIKNTEEAMLTIKKESPNVVDGISAEKFKKTGDGNAAEAMKRVTGVSVEDGQYVYVRGLGGRYTQTTLNGITVPSLDPNKNSLQMDIFPTNVISNMVVSKTFTADQPADFSGGLVNVETKQFPGKQTFKLSGGLGYNPSMHFNDDYLTYEGGNTDFLGFDDGTREIPTDRSENVPYYADALGDDQSAGQYSNILQDFNPTLAANQKSSFMDFNMGMSAGNQFNKYGLQIGYIFSLIYENSTEYYDEAEYNYYGKPNDPSKYELELREKQKGSFGKNSVLIGGLSGLAVKSDNSKYNLNVMHLQNGASKTGVYDYTGADQGSNFQARQHNLTYSERSLTNVLLNGTHFMDASGWKIDWKLSPTFSTINEPDVRFSRIRTDGSGYSIGSESGIPQRIWRFLEEKNYTVKIDLEKEYKFNGKEASFKFGALQTYKNRNYEIQNFSIDPNKVDINGADREDFNSIMADSNLWREGQRSGTIFRPDFIPKNPNKYNAQAYNTGLYVSNEFKPFSRFNAILGIRAEKYTQNYTGYDPVNNEQLNEEKVLDAIDLFPSVNLTYELTKDQNLRLSYAQTIARPSFKEASKATIFDPIAGLTYIGGLQNTGSWEGNLRSTRINNFDLRWEWFQKHGQMVSISGFYKTFDDPIELVQFERAEKNVQPRNVGNGEVMGVEIELRQNLSRIITGMNAFSFNSNVTLTQSKINMASNELESRRSSAREGKEVDDERKMAGQAPFIVNTGIAYKGEQNGLEAGVYYNVKGKTLQIVGVGDRPDVYSVPFHRLKFNASKAFGKKDQYELGMKVSNILGDSKAKVYRAFRAEDQYYSRLNPGTSFSLSFGYNF